MIANEKRASMGDLFFLPSFSDLFQFPFLVLKRSEQGFPMVRFKFLLKSSNLDFQILDMRNQSQKSCKRKRLFKDELDLLALTSENYILTLSLLSSPSHQGFN